ncbi:MAG: hypothetical protein GVY36_03455 [Verrucomicrobia bacterium]|jgi:hypothetical protein|nr:hypothetical protein [Verrucomicrobiota bacterium]
MYTFKQFLLTGLSSLLAACAMAQPAIQISEITGQAGTYAVGSEVTFSFTVTNGAELEEVPAVPDPDTPAAQAERQEVRARNAAKIATNIRFEGDLTGADIYGNELAIPVGLTSSSGTIEPGDSFTFTGIVTIPEDGTLHSAEAPGYKITGNLSYEHSDPSGSSAGTIEVGPPPIPFK